MKKIVLVLCAAIALAMLVPTQSASAAVSNWQKGVSVQSRYADDFSSASFRQSIDNAASVGVNHVTLVIGVRQDNVNSSAVYATGNTPSDAALRSGLGYIKSKGMQSAIALHVDPNDGQWRAHIKANDTAAWFASYGTIVNRYGALAQAAGSSQMVIGTELSGMTVSTNTSRWVQLITNLRTHFKGTLTYSAQRMGYLSDAQTLGFWSSLDKIGLSAYYALGDDSSVSALQSAWDRYNRQEVKVLAARYNKQVIFTEVGYVSREGATSDPGSGWRLTTPISMSTQSNAYQALFQYWANDPNLGGIALWDWSSDPNAGGTNDGGYTPQGKPAQAMMKKWFTNAGTTTPTTPQPVTKYTVSSTAPAAPKTGSSVTIPVTAAASSTTDNVIVNVEIYNAQNQRVAQQFYEHQQLTSSPKTFSINWTPATAGKFTVKVGIFTANWQSTLLWNDSLQTFEVTTPTTPAPQPPTTPTTPPPTQPTTPPTTTAPTAISIWWPGGTVSGVQPYKAVIDGRDLSAYDMFWQVDGGTLNKMADDYNPVAHKESLVDMTNWNWSGTGEYTINFVAKDKAGKILSQKSIILKVVR